MGAVTSFPRKARTRADLAALPDDGNRYELVDGELLVTPAPATIHQTVAFNLAMLLGSARPPGFKVLFAPVDVVLAEDTVIEPDLVVARTGDFTAKDLPVPPLLAIEILSPSTRRRDLVLKRARLESAGCPSYWVVDPEVPSVMAWNLMDGVYVEVAKVVDDEAFHATLPFEVTVVPAELVLD
jgi:Uma2 family endonuclease